MALTKLNIAIDDSLKREAQTLFKKLGLDMETTINIFLRQSLESSRIYDVLSSKDITRKDVRYDKI